MDQGIIPKWPKDWDIEFKNKIIKKSKVDKLTVAGAFFMAENDRIGQNLYQPYIDNIAAEIDRLNEEAKSKLT